jgi:hypothetical protein
MMNIDHRLRDDVFRQSLNPQPQHHHRQEMKHDHHVSRQDALLMSFSELL